MSGTLAALAIMPVATYLIGSLLFRRVTASRRLGASGAGAPPG
jgi:hypothetical protein